LRDDVIIVLFTQRFLFLEKGNNGNYAYRTRKNQQQLILKSPEAVEFNSLLPPPPLGVYHATTSVTGFQKEAELVKLNFQFSSPPDLFIYI
jgi:hypothetical protein